MRRTYREMPAVVPLRCTWAARESAFQATSSRAAVFQTDPLPDRAPRGPRFALDAWAQIGLLRKLKLKTCAPIPACAGGRHFLAVRSFADTRGKNAVIARAGVDLH